LIKLKNWQNHRQNNEEHNAPPHNQYHYRFKSINQLFEITADELAQSDKYEVDDYQRVLGEMASGTSAWAYGFQALLICS
jgi:hypothetical protein